MIPIFYKNLPYLACVRNLPILPLAFFPGTGYNIAKANKCPKGRLVKTMSEEFGPDFITVTDEDGNDFELELVDTLEHQGVTYYAMFPAVEGEEGDGPQDVDLDEEYGLIILKVVEADGEEQLSTLDSEEELELVYQQFMETLFREEDG